MKFWQRRIDLMIGGKSFKNKKADNSEGFTINFNIPFSTTSNTDVSEIQIYNLSEDSISSIKNNSPVILNAGYKDNIGGILIGKVESADTKWSDLDKITTITISDGGLELRNIRIQKTYQANTTAKYIMQDLAGMLGLEVAEIEPKNDITYKLGRTVRGTVKNVLDSLVKDTDSKMYVNKGKLFIREDNKGTETGFVLNSKSGLIDSPEKVEEENEVKYNIKCLLNHKIQTDSLIKIESRTLNGTYRVIEGKHSASDSDFTTELVVK